MICGEYHSGKDPILPVVFFFHELYHLVRFQTTVLLPLNQMYGLKSRGNKIGCKWLFVAVFGAEKGI